MAVAILRYVCGSTVPRVFTATGTYDTAALPVITLEDSTGATIASGTAVAGPAAGDWKYDFAAGAISADYTGATLLAEIAGTEDSAEESNITVTAVAGLNNPILIPVTPPQPNPGTAAVTSVAFAAAPVKVIAKVEVTSPNIKAVLMVAFAVGPKGRLKKVLDSQTAKPTVPPPLVPPPTWEATLDITNLGAAERLVVRIIPFNRKAQIVGHLALRGN